MSDEDDEVEYELDHEAAQEVINWAVDAAATITLMVHEDPPETEQDVIDKLERFVEILQRIYDEMPDQLSDPAHDLAVAAIDRAEFEEEQVQEFLDEIKDL